MLVEVVRVEEEEELERWRVEEDVVELESSRGALPGESV